MKKLRKICATTTIAAILLSASPLTTPVAHAGIDWGGVIGGVLGGVLGGGGSSGGSSGGGNGGGAIGGLSNQKHAHPNPNDNEKLFMLAVEKNDIGTAREMLNAGVDVNGVYPRSQYEGRTGFLIALLQKNYDMMQFLLENGADVNGYYDYDNKYISYIARSTGNPNYDADLGLIQYIVSWGADVNCATVDTTGTKTYAIDNVTHFYAKYEEDKNCAATQFLLEHGAYTENKDHLGMTPFLRSIYANSIKLATVLADGGANINVKDKKGRNALQIALDMNDLQLYKQVQDIMERGQQPSQYQPSKPQTQRRPSENTGNGNASDDELIIVENKTNKNSRRQELNNFNDSIIKAMRAEKKANEAVDKYMDEHPGTLSTADRSKLANNFIDALKKIKDSVEPQTVLSKLDHLSFDEKETCSDLLQIMNTRYDKLIDSYRILALPHDLTTEETEKTKGLIEEAGTLWKSAVDVMGRIDKFPR